MSNKRWSFADIYGFFCMIDGKYDVDFETKL